ncbi:MULTISPECIES: neutral zinc metallopeptidase [Flavobacterium]|jgi:predicted metalloprotease|uniref:Neutral zinc metallopeptidase n=1 Tax=Flavobacterium cupriresistens TaxID=2893885 RepID=A0ABU4R5R7_9FLAO|nr:MULTISPECIES: neutral zinc metallopeptidase [unclassified Flavobacterium]KLT71406.1 metalloprotease [Flavobacterium sp. ABG]MDX6187917.1 neutral zinc metallopeptidase [Flavobacterium sp. Fl-318]UFH42163.1 zinc metallopeptidase [Flavobacterium sp. F-323]
MKWQGRRQSDNVEDRRSISGGKVAVGGGIIGIIILLVNIFGGENAQLITPVLEQLQGGQQTQTEAAAPLSKEDEEMGNFVRVMLAYNEDTWSKIFEENGMTYQKPKLVLFRGSVQTACGGASSSSGPFYCPGDKKVYMDLGFFEELKSKFGAKGGDFAISYVIAHEIGHHIQTLLGTSAKMREAQQGKSEAEANKLSVALELQADFYAGVWAHHNKENLDAGDIDEALSAASAVGDDAIQSKMQGHVVPDSFTHGSSEQRMYWFEKGFNTGDIKQGNTFSEVR